MGEERGDAREERGDAREEWGRRGGCMGGVGEEGRGGYSLDDTFLFCHDSVNANIEQNPHTLKVIQDHQSNCSL